MFFQLLKFDVVQREGVEDQLMSLWHDPLVLLEVVDHLDEWLLPFCPECRFLRGWPST